MFGVSHISMYSSHVWSQPHFYVLKSCLESAAFLCTQVMFGVSHISMYSSHVWSQPHFYVLKSCLESAAFLCTKQRDPKWSLELVSCHETETILSNKFSVRVSLSKTLESGLLMKSKNITRSFFCAFAILERGTEETQRETSVTPLRAFVEAFRTKHSKHRKQNWKR
jgi:hypothetical protein